MFSGGKKRDHRHELKISFSLVCNFIDKELSKNHPQIAVDLKKNCLKVLSLVLVIKYKE